MAYTDTHFLPDFLATVNLVQAADISLGKIYCPSGATFTLEGVKETITTVLGGTTLAQIKVYKNTTLLGTCTAHGLTDAVGTSIYSPIKSTSTCSNVITAGEYFEFKVAVTATTTGAENIFVHGCLAPTSV